MGENIPPSSTILDVANDGDTSVGFQTTDIVPKIDGTVPTVTHIRHRIGADPQSRPIHSPLVQGGDIISIKELHPSERRSLSFISLASFSLGAVVGSCVLISTISLFQNSSFFTSPTAWPISSFLLLLSLFHFLEFWTHAYRNVPNAQVTAFLFSNGYRYTIAYSIAITESLLRTTLLRNTILRFPSYPSPWSNWAGLLLVVSGQIIRSTAILQAGTNFNHIVQSFKKADHKLVTTGIYAHLRHPSYFGFFWWAVGTQLLMGNTLGLVAYFTILSQFFRARILEEEGRLVAFFGDRYAAYRRSTWIGIPFAGGRK